MDGLDFKCDTKNAIDSKEGYKQPVGFITYLKIGNTEVKSKIKTKDPLKKDIEVVGVLSHVHWEGGRSEPILLKGLIYSAGAHELLRVKLHKLESSHISLKFAVYHYAGGDGKNGGWFAAFHHDDDKALECKIALRPDGALALMVDMNEKSTPNFQPFSIFVLPDHKEQQSLHYRSDKKSPDPQPWGHSHG